MAFLDKLNNLAKNVGEKTNDAIETTRMNSKISSEKSKIAEQYKKIGEYYYNKHAQGETLDVEVAEFCTAVDASNQVIKENEEAIQKLKDEREAQKQAAAEAAVSAAQTPVMQNVQQGQGLVCPSCQAVNTPGMKFCNQCGTKLETGITCSNCGTENTPGMKFCNQCGTELEKGQASENETVQVEPVKRVCPSCNAELPENVGFCTQCGHKVG